MHQLWGNERAYQLLDFENSAHNSQTAIKNSSDSIFVNDVAANYFGGKNYPICFAQPSMI